MVKTIFKGWWRCAALPGLVALISTANASDGTATLKVQVSVPTAGQAVVDERVPEVMAAQVRDVFYRRGFYRRIENVRSIEDVAKLPHLLTFELEQWTLDSCGNAAGRFKARLRTPEIERELGSFDVTMTWLPGRGRFGLSDGYVRVPEGPLHELCDRIAEADLLPGLRKGTPAA